MKSVNDFQAFKESRKKITLMTCYDSAFAVIIAGSDIDAILVGDSVSMVVHGFESTVSADLEMMKLHTQAVRRGAPESFIIADMPFLAHRYGKYECLKAAGELIKAGANAVKLEGARGNLDVIAHIVESGIPVMGHLGLTPQSVNKFGGYKVQGKSDDSAKSIIEDASVLEKAGCFSMVLECIPAELAAEISRQLRIPTIGIGAGAQTDGQVLVLYDLLGLTVKIKPRFVRTFMDGSELVKKALDEYAEAVVNGGFPSEKESY